MSEKIPRQAEAAPDDGRRRQVPALSAQLRYALGFALREGCVPEEQRGAAQALLQDEHVEHLGEVARAAVLPLLERALERHLARRGGRNRLSEEQVRENWRRFLGEQQISDAQAQDLLVRLTLCEHLDGVVHSNAGHELSKAGEYVHPAMYTRFAAGSDHYDYPSVPVEWRSPVAARVNGCVSPALLDLHNTLTSTLDNLTIPNSRSIVLRDFNQWRTRELPPELTALVEDGDALRERLTVEHLALARQNLWTKKWIDATGSAVEPRLNEDELIVPAESEARLVAALSGDPESAARALVVACGHGEASTADGTNYSGLTPHLAEGGMTGLPEYDLPIVVLERLERPALERLARAAEDAAEDVPGNGPTHRARAGLLCRALSAYLERTADGRRYAPDFRPLPQLLAFYEAMLREKGQPVSKLRPKLGELAPKVLQKGNAHILARVGLRGVGAVHAGLLKTKVLSSLTFEDAAGYHDFLLAEQDHAQRLALQPHVGRHQPFRVLQARADFLDAYLVSGAAESPAGFPEPDQRRNRVFLDLNGLRLDLEKGRKAIHAHIPYERITDALIARLVTGGWITGDDAREIGLCRAELNGDVTLTRTLEAEKRSAFALRIGTEPEAAALAERVADASRHGEIVYALLGKPGTPHSKFGRVPSSAVEAMMARAAEAGTEETVRALLAAFRLAAALQAELESRQLPAEYCRTYDVAYGILEPAVAAAFRARLLRPEEQKGFRLTRRTEKRGTESRGMDVLTLTVGGESVEVRLVMDKAAFSLASRVGVLPEDGN